MEIINDKIVLNVQIDGIESRFILDTGAPLLISKSLYDQLSIETLAILPNSDANANVDTSRIVKTNEIKLGGFTFNDIPAVVLDLEKTPLRCDGIDGFIGSNLLRLLAIEFKIDKKLVILSTSPEKGMYSDSITLFMDAQNTPLFKVKIGSTIDTVMFDTGDNSFYTSKLEFVDKNLADFNILLSGNGSEGQSVFGKGIESPSYLLKENLQIGTTLFEETRFSTTPANISRVGFKFLEKAHVLLDYPSEKLFFSQQNHKVSTYKTHGFSIYEANGDVFIGNVWNSTPAYKAGLQPGDQIMKIDDLLLKGDFCDVQDKLGQLLEKPSIELNIKSRGSSDIKTFTLDQVSL
ncbi:aspartyl protease family protein [Ekhidna sp.]|uniref:retropepsin-like aspartic protease n=1 Tax=Ekhidna sp. TaxID=2608089 RepID=UPI003CCC11E9